MRSRDFVLSQSSPVPVTQNCPMRWLNTPCPNSRNLVDVQVGGKQGGKQAVRPSLSAWLPKVLTSQREEEFGIEGAMSPPKHLHTLSTSATNPLNKTLPCPQDTPGRQGMEHVELSKGAAAAVQSYGVLEEHLKRPGSAG